MNKQPEALRLADDLEIDYDGEVVAYKSAAELRRLYAANQELLEAAKMCLSIIGFGKEYDAISAAIAKSESEGKQNV
jgi:hypothetical protein